jgi:hypothetical protein
VAETPDDQSLSKRQRQKQRRQQKLQAQQAARQAARRRRVLTTGLIVAVLLGVTGAFVYSIVDDRLEERRLVAEASERLGELGCTEIVEEPILGAAHIPDGQEAANPPDELYPVRPTTSGTHFGAWAITGVYDKVIDERLLVHNLEHGYVNIFYDQDAPADQVEALKDFAREQIDSGRYEKIIVSEWKAGLDDAENFVLTAWGARQHCRDFDEGVVLNFLREWHHLSGNAPERTVAAHFDVGLDPESVEGDFLFPPLDDRDGVEEMTDDDAEGEDEDEDG